MGIAKSNQRKNVYLQLSTKLSVHGDRKTVSGPAVFGDTVLYSKPAYELRGEGTWDY
jgi:hypothetical protein